MVFSHSHKNIWCITSVTIVLFSLLVLTFQYLSSYANTISTGSNILPLINEEISENQIHVKQDPCMGRYIYMYDLPPRFNHDLIAKCHALNLWLDFCLLVQNHGFGPWLNKKSWYATNQFMLSVIFHNRMKKYECLTTSSVIASAIYAPFYPGLDIGRFLWGGFNASVKDAAALDFVKWLRGKSEWNQVLGRDHFFVAGRITWDFRRPSDSNDDSESWGSRLLELPEVKNMTMLTIESSPYGYNDIAIPYPTYFHPSSSNEVFEWQERVRRAGRRRTYLFAFVGAPRPNMKGSIREELISQCENAVNNSCEFVDCLQKGDICRSPMNVMKVYMRSSFCLQPPGDSFTRKSIFDSILAGCIPVFFHPGSAYIQYLWHLPKNYSSYSVFIPINQILNGSVNVGEFLSKISDSDVSGMREEVIKLIPRIIYARNKLESIEDAFDLAVKGVLERIEEAKRRDEEGKNDYFSGEDRMQGWNYYF